MSIVASSLSLTPMSAAADTAPPSASIPQTVSSDSLPTAQINGVVWDQVVVGDVVYAGGSFTSARPAGSPAGANAVSRANLLSYRLSTGALTSWAPVLNGQVRALDLSPDGSRLYVVGQFTEVNGSVRNRIVAFDTASGAVIPSFAASANGQVYAVTAAGSAVYFAGQFTQAAGVARPGGAAAASASTGATTPWAPSIEGGRAFALEVAPDSSKVVIAGNFTTLNGNGNPGYGMGAVGTSTGASVPWAAASIVRNGGKDAAIYNLDSDSNSVYGVGYTFGSGGNLEGGFKAAWSTGTLEWVEDCKGDSYSVAAVSGAVYIANHAHDCSLAGGRPETTPRTWNRGVAFSANATSTVQAGAFAGRPQPSMLHYFPAFNTGSFTGQYQGPWSVAGNADYVVFAGEFTQVNGVPQQGLSRFATRNIAPNKDGPSASGNSWTPSATADGAGTLRISWPTNLDRDNEQLTYRLIRDGATAAPIHTTTARSNFWDRPTSTFVDSGLAPGSSHTYRVISSDPWGNTASSSTITAVAGTSGALGAYPRAVLSDSPTWYYRLGESSGDAANYAGPLANTTRAANVTQSMPATGGSGATRAAAGALVNDPDRSVRFNNSNSSRMYTTELVWSDDSLAVEAWFKTSVASGKIVGFGNGLTSSNSGTYDRHLYLNAGRVVWGVNDGSRRLLESATGMNDGRWHHVVGSVDVNGMSLFVDGALVGTAPSVVSGQRYWGNWRIGGDASWSGNQNFTGEIDEVAIYKTPLNADRILAHYRAGVEGTPAPPANVAPTASFTSTSSGLTASVNAAASADPDGRVVAWAWNFGDGTTGTGQTSSRTYATPGTFVVTLTVTDDKGATATTSRPVAVSAAPPPPAGLLARDGFSRAVSGGWGTAETGGAWSSTASANYAVDGGSGGLVHAPSTSRRVLLNSVSSSSSDVMVDMSIDKPATGGGAYAGVVGRQVDLAYYQARVRFLPEGGLGLQLLNGSSAVLANTTLNGLTYLPGQQVRLRMQVSGSNPATIRAKAWPIGAAEPASWQLSVTDSTVGLQASGSVGVESYLSGSATNSPLTARFDNFVATTIP